MLGPSEIADLVIGLRDPLTLLILGCLGYGCYASIVIFYRFFFHPLANVPGPKLAAITRWYETYYELFKGIGGQFTFEIQRLHEVYGKKKNESDHKL